MQVILDDRELREIKRIARRNRMTVAEWVRQALRAARQQEPADSAANKLRAVREAVQYEYPTGDIGTMLSEIERGHPERNA